MPCCWSWAGVAREVISSLDSSVVICASIDGECVVMTSGVCGINPVIPVTNDFPVTRIVNRHWVSRIRANPLHRVNISSPLNQTSTCGVIP